MWQFSCYLSGQTWSPGDQKFWVDSISVSVFLCTKSAFFYCYTEMWNDKEVGGDKEAYVERMRRGVSRESGMGCLPSPHPHYLVCLDKATLNKDILCLDKPGTPGWDIFTLSGMRVMWTTLSGMKVMWTTWFLDEEYREDRWYMASFCIIWHLAVDIWHMAKHTFELIFDLILP